MKNTIFLISMLAAPAWATTEFPEFFVGAKGGYQWADDDAYQHSTPNNVLWGVLGGLQFSPEWSWDIGYQDHGDLEADATSIHVSTSLIESALRYDWYLQDGLSLYGRLGVAYWDMEKTTASSEMLDATGFSPLGEVGVNYHVTPNLRLSTGYQYIDSIGKSNTGKYDSHGVLVGLTYAFGKGAKPESTLVEEVSPSIQEVAVIESSSQTATFSPERMKTFFKVDSTEMSDDIIESSTGIVAVLNHYPQSRAVVVGHTDSTGSDAYNQRLSELRAQEVANKLVELGAAPTQIETLGKGSSQPMANNQTTEGRAKNRRVEVTTSNFQYQQ